MILKSALLVGLLALVSAQASFADFSVVGKEGEISCTGKDVAVKLSADRSNLSVRFTGQEKFTDYSASPYDSDGDSFVSYAAQDGALVLYFDDRGDALIQQQAEDQVTFDITCN